MNVEWVAAERTHNVTPRRYDCEFATLVVSGPHVEIDDTRPDDAVLAPSGCAAGRWLPLDRLRVTGPVARGRRALIPAPPVYQSVLAWREIVAYYSATAEWDSVSHCTNAPTSEHRLTMLDQIFIRDLSLRCIIGVFPEEREKKQDVLINVVMSVDLTRAGQTDDLHDTVDYKRVTKAIVTTIEPSRFLLIERMAQVVADICLADALVKHVAVTIDKPGALRFAKASAVTIFRARHET